MWEVSVSTCSVERVIGVEDCGEKAEWKCPYAEGHVETCVSEPLERLRHRTAQLVALE